jgi:hypothetical protein
MFHARSKIFSQPGLYNISLFESWHQSSCQISVKIPSPVGLQIPTGIRPVRIYGTDSSGTALSVYFFQNDERFHLELRVFNSFGDMTNFGVYLSIDGTGGSIEGPEPSNSR